ncbi:FAD/NAD(P)-binding protein, partial [Aerococcus urinaeequi]|uniref:FAD/NAD(P)-binding protein n=2 Tax=Bacilli TaxID=91061 RepID=UPI003D6BC81B
MRIAIVGFGIAGASTLIQLSKQFDLNAATDQVDVYETRPRLGAGAPYAEDDDATVINSFPRSLSLDDDNNEDFINWTKVNYPAIDIDNVFAPRTIYGEYVEEYLKPYLAKDYVRHIQAKVTDFQVVDA